VWCQYSPEKLAETDVFRGALGVSNQSHVTEKSGDSGPDRS